MKRTWRQNTDTSVVAAVAQQTAEAADLARIDGQHRLASPHTNPAVRVHADELRDDEHRRTLRALHARAVRTIRVADRRADNAERTLEVLQAAREMSSPARSVLALHRGRTRFMGAALGASLTLSAGSAIGVAELAVKHGNPAEIGYIAEVGLTGLTTAVILYRSHLAQHDGRLKGWKDIVLWVLMVGPLVASAVANAYGTGGVGVACSIGAAAFSLLSYVIADASAETLQTKADEVSDTDESDLRKIATGDVSDLKYRTDVAGSLTQTTDLPAQATDLTSDLATPQVTAQATDPSDSESLTQVTDEAMTQATDAGPSKALTQATSEVNDPVTDPVAVEVTAQVTSKPVAKSRPKSRPKPVAKSRRTNAELIAELDEIVADHYRANPGEEIKVQPVAKQLGIGRDRARALLDQMNVRPLRKAN
jgi:hypothetical protein